jgi:hypothetical protein
MSHVFLDWENNCKDILEQEITVLCKVKPFWRGDIVFLEIGHFGYLGILKSYADVKNRNIL